MNTFSISQLQDYSGIKAHTIRTWEQRYQALKPLRTEGNTRLYDGAQLLRLLNIVSLLKFNYKVSELCTMSDKNLNAIIEEQFLKMDVSSPDSDYFITQMISSGINFDELRFEKIFSHCILRFGLKNTYLHIIYPVLIRLGLLWNVGSLVPAQEHFITNLIRQKILTAIDALPHPSDQKNVWLLFLPEDEFHETPLLMAYFLIRNSGHKVIYLGANLPIESLIDTEKEINPSFILTFLISKKDKTAELDAINAFCKKIKTKKVYVSLDKLSIEAYQKKISFRVLHALGDLENLLS